MPGVLTISSITGEGIDQLVGQLATLVAQVRPEDEVERIEHEVVVHKPLPDEITVERDGANAWTVTGRPAVRAVRFQDLTDDEALAEIVRRLRALGVDRMLTRAGVRDGDVVTIGPLFLRMVARRRERRTRSRCFTASADTPRLAR